MERGKRANKTEQSTKRYWFKKSFQKRLQNEAVWLGSLVGALKETGLEPSIRTQEYRRDRSFLMARYPFDVTMKIKVGS